MANGKPSMPLGKNWPKPGIEMTRRTVFGKSGMIMESCVMKCPIQTGTEQAHGQFSMRKVNC